MNKSLFWDIIKIIILIFLLFNFNVTISILVYMFKLILPFIIGISLAFILNVMLKKIERLYKKIFKRRKIMRPICLFLTLFIIIIICILIYILVVPQVIKSINIIGSDLDNYIYTFSECLSKLGINRNDVNNIVNYILEQKDVILSYINIDKFKNFDSMLEIMSRVSNIMFNVGVGLVFAIYILLQKEKLGLQLKKLMNAYLSCDKVDRINYIAKVSNKIFSNFIGGQFLEAIILGFLCFIGMIILKIPYAMVISIIVTITALIPMFGALIGTSVGVLFILITNPIKAITFVIYIIILQQIEGNFIYPKVVGKTVGLPGIWVVFAVTIGVSLFGLIGMIIAVPIISVIYSLLSVDINRRIKLRKKGIE